MDICQQLLLVVSVLVSQNEPPAKFRITHSQTLRGHTDNVRTLTYRPDGDVLASGSADLTVRRWNLRTGKETVQPMKLKGHVLSLCYSPDGEDLAVGTGGLSDETGRIESLPAEFRLFTSGRGEQKDFTQRSRTDVDSVTISPDGKQFAIASGFEIRLHDRMTKKQLHCFRSQDHVFSAVAFSPSGEHILAANYNQTISRWEVKTGKLVSTIKTATIPLGIVVSPDGKMIAAGGVKGVVTLWDFESSRKVTSIVGQNTDVWSVSFSFDGNLVAVGSAAGIIQVWDLENRQSQILANAHDDVVTCVSFHPRRLELASASFDKTIKVWQIAKP